MAEKTFIINDYITVKYEDGLSKIYIAGEYFRICKKLALQIPIGDEKRFKNISSVDEIDENKEIKITPEVQFWAHCSNLQAWADNDYNTRILHSNLSFPLLEKLVKVGDPKAKRVFKDEIIIKGHIDLLSYYNDCIYIIDYKPEIEIIDMFKSLPQIIAYGFLMKNTLLLNDLKIKCISYNEKESWEYDPFNLFSYIQKFFERLGREHPISKKGWFKYFKALDSYFISF